MAKNRDNKFNLLCALWSFIGTTLAKNFQETPISIVADVHATYATGFYCGVVLGSFLGVTKRKTDYTHCLAPAFAAFAYNVVSPTIHFLPIFTFAVASAVIFDQFNTRHERQLQL